jgi:hypothetical protein
MKILINESQFNLLNEDTNGLDDLINDIIYKYPNTKDYVDEIKNFILNSGCQNISVEKLNNPAIKGLALHDKVVLNTSIFNDNLKLPDFLFVIFHEIAHQYQYRKYGEEKMYEVYIGDLSMSDAAEWMKGVEIVADEFATRKVRQFVKLGLINGDDKLPKGFYKNVGLIPFINLISNVRNEIKNKNIKNKSEISQLFYNMVKSKV